MNKGDKKKLITVSVVYWFMLLYIVAALIWWFVSLQKQNELIAHLQITSLNKKDFNNIKIINNILETKKTRTTQYIGEGATFLILIIVGAMYVFRAIRKQLRINLQQQNFMMAITHELKTPLAVARLSLETLRKRKLDEASQEKLVNNTIQEIERLNDLCSNVLTIARLESSNKGALKEEVELSNIATDCVMHFKRRSPAREIFIDAHEQTVIGDPILLQLLINNLLENALKYSPKDKPVSIVIKHQQSDVILQVKNEGQSISKEEKIKIFNKFYRIGEENKRTTKGTGLGLYLCKKIMEYHGGKIIVADNDGGGSIFTALFKARLHHH